MNLLHNLFFFADNDLLPMSYPYMHNVYLPFINRVDILGSVWIISIYQTNI